MEMKWTRPHIPNSGKDKIYRTALIITLIGNLLLAIGKGIAAWLTHSAALYSDAANSISDVFYSIMMVIGLWMAIQPPDLSHPQGHSRFEPLVGLGITLSMGIAGYEAASTAIERIRSGAAAIDPGLPALILIGAATLKAVMFIVIRRLSQKIKNATLATAAKDNLMDVLSSSAAFLGTLGSFYIAPILDPIAGFLVAGWIFYAAFEAGRENLQFLTGAGASEEIRMEIVKTAESVPGVLAVHHTITEYGGPNLLVDMHVNVAGSKTLIEAHQINDEIIDRLEDIPDVDRAYVHIEPEGWD
jgi:cation diffusion facilitator family transporter